MSILSDAIGIVDSVTQSLKLQCDVSHESFESETGKGVRTYGDPVTRLAVVDLTRKQIQAGNGQLLVVVATVIFPRPTLIDLRDRITLPNGLTGPIINDPNAVVDPETNRAFLNEVKLGSR